MLRGIFELHAWIVLHLAAIAMHAWTKRQPLLRAMWTGRRAGDAATPALLGH